MDLIRKTRDMHSNYLDGGILSSYRHTLLWSGRDTSVVAGHRGGEKGKHLELFVPKTLRYD
jgi:hypothetical protein